MSGHHAHTATGGRARIWLAGLGLAFVAVLIAAFAGPASASAKTVNAQLSLTGLASADNPVGGSQIGIRPGDRVAFSAAAAPTAGLDQLGLSGLLGSLSGATGGTTGGVTGGVGGLVGGLTGSGGGSTGGGGGGGAASQAVQFQVTADFSGLPGGAKNTVLSGNTTKTFTFPKKGSYSFTWTAQQITAGGVVPINLDGNQLQQAGVKLNASNAYVGKVVVADNPPAGGLSVQLPGVNVAPSAPVVGQLPTISIPGVNLPTVSVPVPNLNPGSGSASGASGSGTGAAGGAAGGAAPSSGLSFAPPGISVPQQVVPGGSGVGSGGGSNGGGGFRLGVVGNGTGTGSNSQLNVAGAGSSGGSTSAAQPQGSSSGSGQTVDLASSSASPSGQLPVLLAILAVITLAMVAGIYARLYLLGRRSSAN